MSATFEALTQLVKKSHNVLSDEHLVYDQWSLEWHEHSRSKPNLEYTKSVWAMTKGYLDASEKASHKDENGENIGPAWKRAYFRERLTNLAVVSLTSPETNFVSESKDLEKEITTYFRNT